MSKYTEREDNVKRFNELVDAAKQKYMDMHNITTCSTENLARELNISSATFSRLRRVETFTKAVQKFPKVTNVLADYVGANADYVLNGKGKLFPIKREDEDALKIDESDEIVDLEAELDEPLINLDVDRVNERLAEIAEEQSRVMREQELDPDDTPQSADEAESAFASMDVADEEKADTEPTSDAPLSAEDKWLNAILSLNGDIDNSTNTSAVMHEGILHIFKPAEGKLPWRCEKFRLSNLHKPFETVEYKDDIFMFEAHVEIGVQLTVTVKAVSKDEASSLVDTRMKEFNRVKFVTLDGRILSNTDNFHVDASFVRQPAINIIK